MELKEFNTYRYDYETGVMTIEAFMDICLEFIDNKKALEKDNCDGCIHYINNNICCLDEWCIRDKTLEDRYNEGETK